MALHRRQVLQAGAAGTLAGIAGCLDLSSPDQRTDPDEWSQFRRDSVFSGTSPAEAGPGEDLEESWALTEEDLDTAIAEASDRFDEPGDVGAMMSSSPVVLDETVVFGIVFPLDIVLALVAVDGETGEPVWAYVFDDVGDGGPSRPTPLSPALADGRVYHVVPDDDGGRLVALDLETGEEEWTDRVSWGTPVIRDETIYVVGHETISAFGLDGDRVWETTDVSLTHHRATVTDDAILAMDEAEIVAHDRDGGDELWRGELVDPGWLDGDLPPFTAPVITDGLAVAARSKQRQGLHTSVGLVAFDPETGEVEWGHGAPFVDSEDDEEADGALVGYPVVTDDLVLATATGDGLIEAAGGDPDVDNLFAFDPESGDLEWTTPASLNQTLAPVVAGDVVYLVGRSQIVAISTDGERLAETELADRLYGFIKSPAIANGRLYAPTGMADDDGIGLVAFGD